MREDKFESNRKFAISLQKIKKSKRTKNRCLILISTASSLYATGDFQQALQLCKQALQLDPSNKNVYFLVGLIHEELNNFQKALNSFFAAGIISSKENNRHDRIVWEKVYRLSDVLDDKSMLIASINRLSSDSRLPINLLEKKLSIFSEKEDRIGIFCTKIELMPYHGTDISIFDEIRENQEKKEVVKSIVRLMKNYQIKFTDVFIEKTIYLAHFCKKISKVIYLYEKGLSNKRYENILLDLNMIYLKCILSYYRSKSKNIQSHAILSLQDIDDDYSSKNKESENSKLSKDFIVCKNFNNVFSAITSKFLESDCKFTEKYALELGRLLIKMEYKEQATELIELIIEKSFSIEAVCLASMIYMKTGRCSKAIKISQEYLKKEPVSIKIKKVLYSIYTELYKKTNDSKYIKLAQEYRIFDVMSERNSEFVFNKVVTWKKEICDGNRKNYLSIRNSSNNYCFQTTELLRDFYNNPVVFAYNDRISGWHKGEIMHIKRKSNFVNLMKNVETNNLMLKGLSSKEWLEINLKTIMSFLKNEMFSEASDLANKILNLKLFKEFSIEIFLTVLNVAVRIEDISLMIKGYRYAENNVPLETQYLLLFLTRKFPDYDENKEFMLFTRYLNSIALKKKQTDNILPFLWKLSKFSRIETIISFSEKYTDNDVFTNLLMLVLFAIHVGTRVGDYGLIFMAKIEEVIQKIKNSENYQHNIKVQDYINYNIGKYYSSVGNLDKAEEYYFLSISSEDRIIRRASIFNLSLLWKKNKSRELMRVLFSHFDK